MTAGHLDWHAVEFHDDDHEPEPADLPDHSPNEDHEDEDPAEDDA